MIIYTNFPHLSTPIFNFFQKNFKNIYNSHIFPFLPSQAPCRPSPGSDLMELRVCGVEGIEKEDGTVSVEWVRRNGMRSGVQHQISKRTEPGNHQDFLANCVGSRFSVPIPCHSSVLFFSPSALQTRRSMRSSVTPSESHSTHTDYSKNSSAKYLPTG